MRSYVVNANGGQIELVCPDCPRSDDDMMRIVRAWNGAVSLGTLNDRAAYHDRTIHPT